MNHLWNVLMRPILEQINSKYIIIIGTDLTDTRNIMEYCVDNNVNLTVFDLISKFDIEEFEVDHRDNIEICTDSSLTTLLSLKDYDAIIINDMHVSNNELKIIENNFKNKKFPIILLPYDLNNNNTGIRYNNDKDFLTSLDEFINDSELDYSFKHISTSPGLGILYIKNDNTEKIIKNLIENHDIWDILEKERIKLKITDNKLNNRNNGLQKKLKENKTTVNHLNDKLRRRI